MRPHCAIFVDAGYLLAASATRVTGTSLRRGVQVDTHALIRGLIAQAERESGLPLLRVHWYDAGARPGGMPDAGQDAIGLMPRVKLRLGRTSYQGEQKGVDLKIGLDLATHGRNRVVDLIYLVSGDDDLTEAVEEAQSHGIQLLVLAVPDAAGRPSSVARHLQRAADEVVLIDTATIDSSVRPAAIPDELVRATVTEPSDADEVPEPVSPDTSTEVPATAEFRQPSEPCGDDKASPDLVAAHPDSADAARGAPSPAVLASRRPTKIVAPSAGSPSNGGAVPLPDEHEPVSPRLIDQVVQRVVESWLATATPQHLVDLRKGEPSIPGDLDRALLVDLTSRTGSYDVDEASRHALRARFWAVTGQLRLG